VESVNNNNGRCTGGTHSVASCLAEGLGKRTSDHQTIIYTAENNNHTAEVLRSKVEKCAGGGKLVNFQFQNTDIGKMSSIAEDPISSPPSNTATSGGKTLPHLQDIWIYYASNGGEKEVFR